MGVCVRRAHANTHFRLVVILFAVISLILQGCGQATFTPIPRSAGPTEPPLIRAAQLETPTVEIVETSRPAPSEIPPESTLKPTAPVGYTGPLSTAQQEILVQAAQGFLAETPNLAERIAKKIGEESAASIDGPLVIALLSQAGLLPVPVNPHQLWLLDPLKDWQLAKKVFPKEDYQWITYSFPLDQLNVASNLLFAGDILYVAGGNSEVAQHYFLITRVDEQGRVYSTTNVKGPSGGYLIQELYLLDSRQARDSGQGTGALTGAGKVLVWRLRDRRGQSAFDAQLNRVLDRGGKWNALVKKVGGATEFERDAEATIHPASVIKIPVAMLVIRQLEQDPRGLNKALETGPVGAGRSFEQLLNASLVKSEEEATGELEKYLFDDLGEAKIHSQLDAWGAQHTQIEPRRTTARDIAALLEGLSQQTLLTPQASQVLLNLLSTVTSGDTARLWKLNGLLPSGSKIYNKRGTLTDPLLIVADAGIITLPDGHAYILCLFGYPEGDGMETYEDLDASIGDFAVAWYRAQFMDTNQP